MICWGIGGVKLVFDVTEREVGKKGKNKGRGLWGNFRLELFVKIAFPSPCELLITWKAPPPTFLVVLIHPEGVTATNNEADPQLSSSGVESTTQ